MAGAGIRPLAGRLIESWGLHHGRRHLLSSFFDYEYDSGSQELETRPSPLRRSLRAVLVAAAASAVISGVAAWKWLGEIGFFELSFRDIESITKFTSPDRTQIFDRNGGLMVSVYANHHIFVPFNDLPERMRQAIVAAEDKNFFAHPGYDLAAMARSLRNAVSTGRFYGQGASTISQQVVRKLALSREKTIARKVKEIYLANLLEENLHKERIFELYANNMFLGAGAYGVGAAALRYFGKNLSELGLKETAVIAGLFQLPSVSSPFQNPERAESRARYVLTRMLKLGFIDAEAWRQAVAAKPVYVPYRQRPGNKHPYFVDQVLAEAVELLPQWNKDNGLRVHTTFDPAIQGIMDKIVTSSAHVLQKFDRAVFTGRAAAGVAPALGELAMLAMRPDTGDVVAMVGGRNYGSSQFNRAWQARRSPGSAFKPVAYAQALGSGFKWSDLFFVSPIDIEGYRPKDMENNYLTETTLLRAFYRSVNTTAIELGMKVGVDHVIALARKLGVTSPLKQEAGTVIGSSAVTMPEMASVYGALANGGREVAPAVIDRIEDAGGRVLWRRQAREMAQAVDPKIAFLIQEGMRAVLKHGTGHAAARLAEQAVGKSGTSDRSIDNWFCGFTTDLVLIAWVGTDGNLPAYGDISGSSVALPLWGSFMDAYLARHRPPPFNVPEGVVAVRIDPSLGTEDEKGVQAWFLNGNLPQAGGAKALSILKESGRHRRAFGH